MNDEIWVILNQFFFHPDSYKKLLTELRQKKIKMSKDVLKKLPFFKDMNVI